MENYIEKWRLESAKLYPPKFGTISIQLENDDMSATALITEHKPFLSQQHILEVNSNKETIRTLPVGIYSIAITAKEYGTYRTQVELTEENPITITARLQKQISKPTSVIDKLSKYGIKIKGDSLPDLILKKNQKLLLNPKSPELKDAAYHLELNTIDDVKRVLGTSDEYWTTNYPRFGQMVLTEPKIEDPRKQVMSSDLRAAYREYVHGNSKSVIQWKDALDFWITHDDDKITFDIFAGHTVEIPAGSTLTLDGSKGLVCHWLRVNFMGGVLKITGGPTKVDTNVYELYRDPF